jgi:iron(III) transport system ATP-binding protein
MSVPPILDLHQLTQTFDRTAHPAVNQISLQLESGEILGLLGPSGCGKTTLLRLIAGFSAPQVGNIYLAGQLIATPENHTPAEKRDIGMVFQDYALFPHLTVIQNVTFGLQQPKRKKFTLAQIRDLSQNALALVGLTGLGDRYPHELSGGQQQRVALARALAPQPALILLDEPLSNLDVQVRLYLRQEIRTILKTAGTAAIFVTHDQEEALSICDRVAVMNQGNLEQIDPPEALYQNPKSRFVAEFITQANFIPARLDQGNWHTELGKLFANGYTQPTAELMIRQEDLQIVRDDSGHLDQHRLVVRDRQFLGREYCYWLMTTSGQSLYARSPIEHHSAQHQIMAGDQVKAIVHPDAIRVFPVAD